MNALSPRAGSPASAQKAAAPAEIASTSTVNRRL